MSDPLATIRRRLERLELEHLRRHAAEIGARCEHLQAENDQLRSDLRDAWADGDAWHDRMLEMINTLPDGIQVGITQEGQIGVTA